MGSGSVPFRELSEPLGQLLADMGVHLLTGGGSGVMEAVSKAFVAVLPREGNTIGILPSEPHGTGPKRGYPNPWIEIPIYTHLPHSGTKGTEPLSRNHINVLSSDVLVFLPGSEGTRSELTLALQYQKPILCLGYKHMPDRRSAGVRMLNTLDEVRSCLTEILGP